MVILILRYLGLATIFLWFFVGGIAHFTSTDFFVSIVPPWVPFPLWAVYVSGAIELVLAVLVLWSLTRRLAGWGLIALTIAVTPANLHMYMNSEQFPSASETTYFVRLIVQVILLLTIWWSTKPHYPRSEKA